MYQNNQFNNNMGGMGYPNQAGTSYGQFPTAKMTQPLTPEQMKQLRSTGSGFSLKVEELEIIRSQCTHKDNGNIALVKNSDGTSTCTICGATFNLVDDAIAIQDISNAVIDVLQSIKTYYLDIPENYVKDYFTMIPYIEKLSKFFDVAIHNFTKYENGSFLNQNNNMYGFQMLGALTSPGFGNMGGGFPGQSMYPGQPQTGFQGQPQPGYPQTGFQGQPMNNNGFQGQPMNNNGFQGQPQTGGYNPFGGVQPTGYPQQPTPQPGYGATNFSNPTQQIEQGATEAPAATNQTPQVVSTKTFNV